MITVTDQVQALDKKTGPPLDLVREVLDAYTADYEVPQPEEGDNVVRKIGEVPIDPFLEPNSVVFIQHEGKLTHITAIEQLTKVKCVAFRSQLSTTEEKVRYLHKGGGGPTETKTVHRQICKSDLINSAPNVTDLKELKKGAYSGRILLRAKKRDLYILYETRPGYEIGQCESSVTIKDCLREESPMEQTTEIRLRYIGDDPFFTHLEGVVYTWKF